MISKNIILGILPPFQNKQNVILENQNVSDIITGILNTHKKYAKDYDKIYEYFIGEDLEQTGRNIFDFLKTNVPYFIESNEFQYLKSPASIISTKGDCKSYALFACGVLQAFARNKNPDLEVYYRFASYDPFNKTPEHVYCVVKEYGQEYWIDPVLDRFNQRKEPYFYKDKKLNTMALVGLSGIDNSNQNDQMGTFDFSDLSGDSGSGGIDWSNLLNTALKTVPTIISATKGGGSGSGSGNLQVPPPPPPAQSTGISTNTMLLVGAGAIALIFLLKK